jgi:hypothetical protein
LPFQPDAKLARSTLSRRPRETLNDLNELVVCGAQPQTARSRRRAGVTSAFAV